MKNKNTFFLISSQLLSVIGTTLVQFLIALYVLDSTKSAQSFSLVMASSMIGRLVCLPFCGVLIDRLSKKRLLIFIDSTYLVLTLLFIYFHQKFESLFLIIFFVFLLGLVSAFETPTTQASVSLIFKEEDVPKLTGIITAIGMLGNLVGPIIASIVYQHDKIYFSFFLCSILFLVATFIELGLRIPYERKTNSFAVFSILKNDYQETYSYLKAKRNILSICLLAFLLNFIITSFIQVMIPFITRVHLHISNQQYGVMNMLFALGSLIGAIVYSAFSKKIAKQINQFFYLISVIFILSGSLLFFIQNQIHIFWIITFGILCCLTLLTMISVHLLSSIQLIIEPNFVGRVISIVLILSTLATPLGQLLWGLFSQNMTLYNFYLSNILLGIVIFFVSKPFFKTLNNF